jgi:hypothetical protein
MRATSDTSYFNAVVARREATAWLKFSAASCTFESIAYVVGFAARSVQGVLDCTHALLLMDIGCP